MDTFHPDYVPPEEGSGYDWRCMRCGYQWRSRRPNEPKPLACAGCRSAYWDKPAKNKVAAVEGAGRVESKKRRTGKVGKRSSRKRKTVKKEKQNTKVTQASTESTLALTIPAAPPELPPPSAGEAVYGLTPPPHLRQPQTYVRRQDEPAPENMIRKPQSQPVEEVVAEVAAEDVAVAVEVDA